MEDAVVGGEGRGKVAVVIVAPGVNEEAHFCPGAV